MGAVGALHEMETASLMAVAPELVKELCNDARFQQQYRDEGTVGDEVAAVISRLGRPSLPFLARAMVDRALPSAVRVRAAAVFAKISPARRILPFQF